MMCYMVRIKLLLLVLLVGAGSALAKDYSVKSPSGRIALTVHADTVIGYDVVLDGTEVAKVSKIELDVNGHAWPKSAKGCKVSRKSQKEALRPVVPLKRAEIDNNYNTLRLDLKGGYGVEFLVNDEGVAHRFVTSFGDDNVTVAGEVYNVTFPDSTIAHLQQTGGFITSYEEYYSHKPMEEWTPEEKMSTLPVLAESGDGARLALVSESDLNDYPAMFLKGDGKGGFTAVFPKLPAKYGPNGDRSLRILEEHPYIASTKGKRTYPWRFMAVGAPADILNQTMACRLASPCEIDDTSWIQPGKVSWEWWNGWAPYGDDVDFETGQNLETYKYFIDFAKHYGIEYILLDEGWAKSTLDPFTPNPGLDLHALIDYGEKQGVGVFVWLTWLTVENNLDKDLFKTLAGWGLSGVKIDFMDRSDQWMVNFYERVCRRAAEDSLLVDMHGSFKPAGLEHRFPNLLSYEGVRGMEQMGGCRPDNTLYLPFMRNAVGAMDYTPGAMISMQPECYVSERPNSASIGTRAYQMALYTLFESGVQMLADNPTMYYRNDDCTRFISTVPVTWDETVVLAAETGKYIVEARRKGNDWWLAAICNGEKRHRQIDVPLDFLYDSINYDIVSFSDGPNANRQAMDYRKKQGQTSSKDTLSLRLSRNGGYTARLTPAR